MSPRYIGSPKELEQVRETTYKLSLLPTFSIAHPIFHVSMLKKYVPDDSHMLSYEGLDVQLDLTYEEEVVQIIDHSRRTPFRRKICIVKVL